MKSNLLIETKLIFIFDIYKTKLYKRLFFVCASPITQGLTPQPTYSTRILTSSFTSINLPFSHLIMRAGNFPMME